MIRGPFPHQESDRHHDQRRDQPIQPGIRVSPDPLIEPAPPRHVRAKPAPKMLDPAIFGLGDFPGYRPGASRRRSCRPATGRKRDDQLDQEREEDMTNHFLALSEDQTSISSSDRAEA